MKGISFALLVVLSCFATDLSFAQFEGNPLSQAVDNTEFNFLSDNPGFEPQTSVFTFGGDAVVSQPIGNDQVAVMATSFADAFGLGGNVTFDWQVSSERDFDFLVFAILTPSNDIVTQRQISGQVGWQTVSVDIPVGDYVLAWGYVKDGSVSSGLDRGYVDRVRIQRNQSQLPPTCTSGSTPLNSALDNEQLIFTNFNGNTTNLDFSCQSNIFNFGGAAAISDAVIGDSSSLWVDLTGPLDLVFDWRIVGGNNNEMKIELRQGNQIITPRREEYFAIIEGPTDWETARVRVPRGEFRMRWIFRNVGNQLSSGLIDNVRIEPPTIDPDSVLFLPSILELLNE